MSSVKLQLYKHKILKDGSHPIIIQLIKERKKKTISTGYSATESQWNSKTNLPNAKHPNHQLLSATLKRKVIEVQDLILEFDGKNKDYSLDDIVNKIKKNTTSDTFASYSDSLIDTLNKNGKLGNARVYAFTKNMFLQSIDNQNIRLNGITYKEVRHFQDFLTQKGNKTNSISVHLRTLRAIVNHAIKEGLIERDAYPFKDITIKTEKTRKRAVNKDIVSIIERFQIKENESLQLCRDLFMFSFYNRGMSFVDIAFLKVSDLENGRIIYRRKKTGQLLSIKITEKAQQIINRYANLNESASYIFPIIKYEGNEYLQYRNAMRLTNKKLKELSNILKLDVPLTTYVSRHSWATIAKKSGISTAIISEGLGHDSEETTQVYLDSFDTDVLDDVNEQIIN